MSAEYSSQWGASEKTTVQDAAQSCDTDSHEAAGTSRGIKRGLKSRHAQLIALGGTAHVRSGFPHRLIHHSNGFISVGLIIINTRF